MNEPALTALIQIAQLAGEAILQVYHSDFSVEQKDDDTPLTEADLQAHEILLNELEKLSPLLPVLSEESSPVSLPERQQWQRYWLIDPLDGTREFINKTGQFSVNIALVDQNKPVLGIVYAPVSGRCYYAKKGDGAYRLDANQKPQRIRTRKVSEEHFVVTTSKRAEQCQRTRDFLQQLPNYELLTMGSAIKSCLVAEGKADLYPRIGPTSEWDTAAAQIIIEESGGQLTDMNLEPLRYNTKDSLLNPDFLAFADDSVDWRQYLDLAESD